MSRKLLLDTSVIIDFLRIKDKSESLFYKLVSEGSKFSISIVTHTELYSGKSIWENKIASDELEIIFENMEIANLTREISITAGEIRAKYDLDLIDAIIASTAIQLKVPLATLNFKDFFQVKNLKLLDIK
jgi:tRNA(fMet)-specific endonuclease VapC